MPLMFRIAGATASSTLVAASATMLAAGPQPAQPEWPAVEQETMRHFQALLRIDTADPPGHERPAALPTMSTGATDMAYLRGKGIECYGIGELHRFVRFSWDAVVTIAGAR